MVPQGPGGHQYAQRTGVVSTEKGREAGLEPATSDPCVLGSYPIIGGLALYQLSYSKPELYPATAIASP